MAVWKWLISIGLDEFHTFQSAFLTWNLIGSIYPVCVSHVKYVYMKLWFMSAMAWMNDFNFSGSVITSGWSLRYCTRLLWIPSQKFLPLELSSVQGSGEEGVISFHSKMDVLPSGNIFRELQVVHDTGYFSAQPSLEDRWQQVRVFPWHSIQFQWFVYVSSILNWFVYTLIGVGGVNISWSFQTSCIFVFVINLSKFSQSCQIPSPAD